MSTLKTNTIKNTDDVEMYLAKAWVNFNGTGTVAIRAAGNVSSITDNGTGDYSVNFTTAMPDTNYAISQAGQLTVFGNSDIAVLGPNRLAGTGAFNTTSIRLSTGFTADASGTAVDPLTACIVVYR